MAASGSAQCTSNPRAMIFAAIFGILGMTNTGDP
jgi:hypothetical protein